MCSMKKIAMFTMGTRGDVQPYIFLSKELMKNGYDVTLGSHPCWKKLIEEAGICFSPIGPDIDIEKEAAIIRGKVSNPALSMLKTMNFVFRIILESTHEIFEVCKGKDLIIVSLAEHKWFNKDEKGKASSFILNGCFFGPVVGPAVVVWLMTTFGWHHVFLSFGVVGLLLAWAWHKYVTDDPKDSPYVNEAELAHINEGRVEATGEKQIAPWGKLLRSSQFWALGIQFLITDYIMYVFLAWLPMYLMEVHKFSLAKMGIWAAAPWISLMAVVTLCGHYSDKLLRNGMSQNMVKTATGAAGILLCAGALYISTRTADPMMNVLWLSVSLGSLGLTMSASWSSVITMGGKFAGSVSGWMNFWGNIGGVLAPTVTAWFATNYGWQAALAATAVTGICGAIAWFFVKPDKAIV